jgi:hypothetical protein
MLQVSRGAVRKVLRSGVAEVPDLGRDEKLGEHIDRVRELHQRCDGNRVRVHEELLAEGIEVGYPTLTAFCRGTRLHVVARELHRWAMSGAV